MFVGCQVTKAVLFACLFAAQAQAQVQPQLVDLKYDVDSTLQGCPSVSEFRAIVAQQLGYDPSITSTKADIGVVVRVRATESGLEASIDWSTADANELGERRFATRSENCREMMTTVGFVVAVQLQLMATAKPPAPQDQKELNRRYQSPADLQPNQERSVTLAVADFELREPWFKSPRWFLSIGLGSSIALRTAPKAVAEGSFFFAAQRGRLAFEFGGEASLASTKYEDFGGAFRHRLVLSTAAACGLQKSLAVCVVGKLGQVHVRGTAVDKPATSNGLVAQVGPRLAYSLGLSSRIALRGRIDALYLLTPWTVELNQMDVWKMPRLSAVTGIDLEFRFR